VLRPSVGGRVARYSPLIALALGSSLGGCVLGTLLAILSLFLSQTSAARAGTTIAVSAISALGLLVPGVLRWLPDRECQVRKYFIYERGKTWAAFRWGIELGLGVCTFFVTPARMALLVLGAAQRSPAKSFWVGATYGTTRGVAMLLFTVLIAKGLYPSPESIGDRAVARTRLPLLALIIAATAVVLLNW
jgi:hypothetical protein